MTKNVTNKLTYFVQNKIKNIALPKKNNELWSFFPVQKIQNVVMEWSKNDKIYHNLNNEQFTEFDENDIELKSLLDTYNIKNELDIAALLPFANNALTFKKEIPENTTEHAIIKRNDDFAHSQFTVQKNGCLYLEILDNKVPHSIVSERFDIYVQENAKVHIFFIGKNNIPLNFMHFRITQENNSKVYFSEIEQGGEIKRISLDVYLKGENAKFEIRNLNALSQKNQVHHRITIYHEAPNTKSVQFSRNLLDCSAYASYDGQVIVEKENCKVYSSQLINTILLSENASVSVKPVLKIYHDDVECTHGNTCGELDPEQLFYLESRGISIENAKKLLIKAFAKELFTGLEDSPAKKRLEQELEDK